MLKRRAKVTPSKSNKLTEKKWFREGKNSFVTDGQIVHIFCWSAKDSIRIYNAQRSLIQEFGTRFDEVKVYVNGKGVWWINLHPCELLAKIG